LRIGGGEVDTVLRVFVVDDDPFVRKMLQRVLEQAGFQVWTTGSGLDALLEFLANPSEIDLLVTDIKMPGMDGTTLAALMLSRNPDLPVLFISGTYDTCPMRGDKPFPFLPKPFTPSRFLCTIRAALGKTVSASGGAVQ
jgi:two-component system cell cycle sensor histidine kinase/response regulator CckA